MKKTLIILLCLFSFNTLSYASFPIANNYTETLENLKDNEPGHDPPSPYILIPLNLIILFGLYFAIRAWWRAWRDDIKFARLLTYIFFSFILLVLLIPLIFGDIVGGMGL